MLIDQYVLNEFVFHVVFQWTFVIYLNEVRLWIHHNTRGMEHWEVSWFTFLFVILINNIQLNFEKLNRTKYFRFLLIPKSIQVHTLAS